MEHESFENQDVAAVMNEHYVNIKVDREERPDVDQLYMTFVQVSIQNLLYTLSCTVFYCSYLPTYVYTYCLMFKH